jgi:RHS repeat-associated protein
MLRITNTQEPITSARDAEHVNFPLSAVGEGQGEGAIAFCCYDGACYTSDTAGTKGDFLIRYQYDPCGSTYSTSAKLAGVNPFRFSSKYTDPETGLLYYGFRYCQPETGSWLSPDSC